MAELIGSGPYCIGGHVFVWAGDPDAMPWDWPCQCGQTRREPCPTCKGRGFTVVEQRKAEWQQ